MGTAAVNGCAPSVFIMKNGRALLYRVLQVSIPMGVNKEMDFQEFPFDEHVCNLEVSSISFLSEKV